MGILFASPQAEYQIIRDEWLASIEEIAANGVWVGGTAVARFEEAFANKCDVPEAVGTANGTDALYLALKALRVGPGDEVITAANSFIATANAIHRTGASVVLADCRADSYLIDLEEVQALVTHRTRAIIPVHLYGEMVDLAALAEWADKRDIAIVEDCAQAAGALLAGKPAGSWGKLGCFSFYPDKNLGALGDGGAVTASSEELAATLRKLRNHGGLARYEHEMPAYNSRLDPIQASALAIKLRYLDEWSEYRIRAAGWYQAFLADEPAVTLPALKLDRSHVYHLYVIRLPAGHRDPLKKHLQKKGILTAVQYPVPIHRTPAYASLAYPAGARPHAERFAGDILSLPMHIGLKEEDVWTVTREIRSYFHTRR
jgi:dTDP-4-amino-4,6-dideoxygalactose transaminase